MKRRAFVAAVAAGLAALVAPLASSAAALRNAPRQYGEIFPVTSHLNSSEELPEPAREILDMWVQFFEHANGKKVLSREYSWIPGRRRDPHDPFGTPGYAIVKVMA